MQVGNRRWRYYSLREISSGQKPTSVETFNVDDCGKIQLAEFTWEKYCLSVHFSFYPAPQEMYVRGFSYAHSELTLLFTLQTKLIQEQQGGYISKLYIKN